MIIDNDVKQRFRSTAALESFAALKSCWMRISPNFMV
jgi:hypothetical protein